MSNFLKINIIKSAKVNRFKMSLGRPQHLHLISTGLMVTHFRFISTATGNCFKHFLFQRNNVTITALNSQTRARQLIIKWTDEVLISPEEDVGADRLERSCVTGVNIWCVLYNMMYNSIMGCCVSLCWWCRWYLPMSHRRLRRNLFILQTNNEMSCANTQGKSCTFFHLSMLNYYSF